MGRFHVQWRRENPTEGIRPEELPAVIEETRQLFSTGNPLFAQVPEEVMSNLAFEFGGRNVGGRGNYVILEAEGCRPLCRLQPELSQSARGCGTGVA